MGESGCGKTTVGRTMLGLYPATEGQVEIDGHDVVNAKGKDWLPIRRKAQMIFQDPFASLNPRWTVNAIVSEPLRVHGLVSGRKEQAERVVELLEVVGLSERHVNRFPHEFSGGQRQRIGIARALASDPLFIVCDEPISALDVSIQAQVVNLLEDLQAQLDLTYLFIAHDLSMVRHICSRVAVMYLGVIMELADRDELYEHPLHPYTKALLSAVPIPHPKAARARQRVVLEGDVPSPIDPPPGCRFHTRCPIAAEICSQTDPSGATPVGITGWPATWCSSLFRTRPDRFFGNLSGLFLFPVHSNVFGTYVQFYMISRRIMPTSEIRYCPRPPTMIYY